MASNCRGSPATGHGRPTRLHELTPSAKLTYLVVDRAAPQRLTVTQLRERTRLADRTLRRAIADLDEAELIVRRWRVADGEGPRREIVLADAEQSRQDTAGE
ncbi:hypothetical protein [Halorientalis regularis]|jgi:DNA-binding MarR family transcriptional regulator|uniref:MarR family protein n=1 Tax=Halorientalis regularis TaxID=660518 RepID=A0A1G7N9I5_9EURY|nr:hypothetical protein [Halorientalis regularis]SDF70567.1 hypothetical protein SAMN05216218_108230 [Halorientalis regularis]